MPVITRRATQQEARYTPAGGLEKCGYCRHFVSQGACTRVLGSISPRGWCKYFAREMVSHGGGVVGSGSGIPTDTALDLNFLTTTTLDPRITFTRASTATYFDATGTMQTAAANVARFDYDPVTHTARGLLIEEVRTNLLLNSATLGTQSITTTAVATTLSFYGTGTVTMSGSFAGSLVGTGAFPARVSQTFTPTAGTLTLTVTGSVLNAQVEAGAFATSYIPTTGAAATRQGDLATAPTSPWFNPNAGTFAAEGTTNVGATSVAQYAVASMGINNANSIEIRTTISQLTMQFAIIFGGSAQVALSTSPTIAVGAISKTAGTYSAATSAAVTVATNASSVVSGTAASVPAATNLGVGYSYRGAPTYINGYVRRIRYWSRALSNIELMAVTT